MRLDLRALHPPGAALILAGTLVLGPAMTAGPTQAATGPDAAQATATAQVISSAVMGTVCQSGLPHQADDTLKLIARSGPFPYSKDGEVFKNFEGILPSEPTGYYHSYTVVTPGSSTRGARRIVTAEDGTDYYTADHYASFAKIDSSC